MQKDKMTIFKVGDIVKLNLQGRRKAWNPGREYGIITKVMDDKYAYAAGYRYNGHQILYVKWEPKQKPVIALINEEIWNVDQLLLISIDKDKICKKLILK